MSSYTEDHPPRALAPAPARIYLEISDATRDFLYAALEGSVCRQADAPVKCDMGHDSSYYFMRGVLKQLCGEELGGEDYGDPTGFKNVEEVRTKLAPLMGALAVILNDRRDANRMIYRDKYRGPNEALALGLKNMEATSDDRVQAIEDIEDRCFTCEVPLKGAVARK